ncbi:MAG: methyltransferase domain-containing protein [Gammaproteobacteria bacterium]
MPNDPSLSEQATFYDERWARDANEDRLNGYQLARAAAIFDALSFLDLNFTIRKMEPFDICDFGCGRGWIAAQLAAIGRVTGVDLSPHGVAIAEKRWPHIRFECADILEYSAREPFDLLVSSEVIEHILEKDRFVAAVARNLKRGGFAIITTPNARARRAWELDGQLSQPIEEWPSLSELRDLFVKDFEILSHKTFVQQYTYRGIHRVLSAPKLIKFLRQIRLLEAYEGLERTIGIGLHQVLVARRR